MSVSSHKAVLASFVLLSGSQAAFAQDLTGFGVSYASAEIFEFQIGLEETDQIQVLNNDQTELVGPVSLEFYEHFTYTMEGPGLVADSVQIRLLLADALADTIWSYSPPPPGSEFWIRDVTPAFENTTGTGLLGPDGLSRGQGFFSLVSATPNTNAAVWLLPTAEPEVGDLFLETTFLPPRLLDDTFSVGGTPLPVFTVEETLVSPVDVGPVGFGDVLVVVSDRNMILQYPAAQVAALAAGTIPENSIPPTVLLDETQLGTAPISGIAFWPVDNSLLVALSGGDVLWLLWDGTDWVTHPTRALFTSGQGQGKFKIRADRQNGIPSMIMADNRGQVLVFDGVTPDPIKIITDGVQNLRGITVTDTVAIDAVCLHPGGLGCDPLSSDEEEAPVFFSRYFGDNPPASFGSLKEQTCIARDVRPDDDGVCTPNETLVLGDICPEFATETPVTISHEICGVYDPGTNTYGLAFIKADTPGFEQVTDQMFVQVFGESLFPPGVENPCPREAIGRSGIPGEEEPYAADAGAFVMIDGIGGCNSPGASRGRTLSFYGLGRDSNPPLGDPAIDPVKKEDVWPVWRDSLAEKFSRLAAELDDAEADLLPMSRPERNLFDEIGDCHLRAERDALKGQRRALRNAAIRLIDCDELIDLFETNFGFARNAKNPYGTLRGMLLHLYFVIQQRILEEPPDQTAFDGFYAGFGQ